MAITNKDIDVITSALREAYLKCNGTLERGAVVKTVSILARDLKIRYPKLDVDQFIANTIPNGGDDHGKG